VSKVDAPSGTAITLRQIVEGAQPGTKVEVTSHRVGDAKGEHVVTATGPDDIIELKHDALSRRGFALGAVRAAEWLNGKEGVWDFRDIFDQL
jgi:4-hydroxy-tetrahydrodipicolinate reductase